MTEGYRHLALNGKAIDIPVGKVVCVGRNYAKHAEELGNEIPREPLLFLKPKTALCSLHEEVTIPGGRGSVHYETELVILLKRNLKNASIEQVADAIWGYGLALDLTLRDLQSQLKNKGQPWEKAKAFDGACPVSRFIPAQKEFDQTFYFEASLNNAVVQHATSDNMLWPVLELISDMSQHFSLEAGDVILTGTPEGVGPLTAGDEMFFRLGFGEEAPKLNFETLIVS